MRFRRLEWTESIAEKIMRKHNVDLEDVKQVCSSQDSLTRRGRRKMYIILGQTEAGRYLSVVLAPRNEPGVFAVVTARDMDNNERKLYQREKRR